MSQHRQCISWILLALGHIVVARGGDLWTAVWLRPSWGHQLGIEATTIRNVKTDTLLSPMALFPGTAKHCAAVWMLCLAGAVLWCAELAKCQNNEGKLPCHDWGNPCEMWSGKSGTDTGYPPSTSVSSVIIIPPMPIRLSLAICDLTDSFFQLTHKVTNSGKVWILDSDVSGVWFAEGQRLV